MTLAATSGAVIEQVSIDEAYLDMTGTERLHGPPLRAAHLLHQRMKSDTNLNCSVGIATARMVAPSKQGCHELAGLIDVARLMTVRMVAAS